MIKHTIDITMFDGLRKNIALILPGEYILGLDHNNRFIQNKVIEVITEPKTSSSENFLEISGCRNLSNNENKRSKFVVHCTPDQLIWSVSENKFVETKNLKLNSLIYYSRFPQMALSFVQEQILLGKLLGDGSIRLSSISAFIEWSHRIQDKEYVEWSDKGLDGLGKIQSKLFTSGYGTTMVRARTISSPHIKNKFGSFIEKGKKIVPDWVIEELQPLSMAFWYMDDGSLSSSKLQSDRAVFHTCAFSQQDCEILLKAFSKFGITGSINDTSKSRKENAFYPTVYLNTEGSEKFFGLVAPYIPPCMQRKLPNHYKGYPGFLPKTNGFYAPSLMERKISKIEKIGFGQLLRYKLITESGNYFAGGVLVGC